MNQWCTHDSDGCGQFKQKKKNNILHLGHLSDKLLMNIEEKSKLISKKIIWFTPKAFMVNHQLKIQRKWEM